MSARRFLASYAAVLIFAGLAVDWARRSVRAQWAAAFDGLSPGDSDAAAIVLAQVAHALGAVDAAVWLATVPLGAAALAAVFARAFRRAGLVALFSASFAGALGLAFALSLAAAASERLRAGSSVALPCEPPASVVLAGARGAVALEREAGQSSARVLQVFDGFTAARWAARVFVPPLAAREVPVHLYPVRDAPVSALVDEWAPQFVRFFLVCRARDGRYVGAPARVRSPGRVSQRASEADAFVGLTFAPDTFVPALTLVGVLPREVK